MEEMTVRRNKSTHYSNCSQRNTFFLTSTLSPISFLRSQKFISGSKFQGKTCHMTFWNALKCSPLALNIPKEKSRGVELKKGKRWKDSRKKKKQNEYIRRTKTGHLSMPSTCRPPSFSSQVSLSTFISKWVAGGLWRGIRRGAWAPLGFDLARGNERRRG